MADKPSPTPASYHSNKQSSPSRLKWKAVDVNNLGTPLKPDAELDRKLEVWDSMDCSLLVSLDEFEKKVLWPKTKGDFPEPTSEAVAVMSEVVNELFADGERHQVSDEDVFARAMVDRVFEKIALPGDLRAAHSQYSYHKTDPTKSKVDAALYPENVVPQNGCPDWTHLRLFIEFKRGGTANDPFDDKSDYPEAWAQSRQAVRGQLIAYASNTFKYQHRTALYSLLINGDEFRGMYWDRSGLIVTKATNYVEDPRLLLRFLWAFASLSKEEQGIDPSATLLSASSEDYKLMDACALENTALDMPFHEFDDLSKFPDYDPHAFLGPAAGTRRKKKQPMYPVFKFVRDGFRESLAEGWPRYKLLVGEHDREFLVAQPRFTATSMFGRGTRGYIAWDVTGKRFVWLKDSWRPFYEGVDPEGTYLETMASKPNPQLVIPTVVAHGDVLKQTTFAAEYTTSVQAQPGEPSAADVPSGDSARANGKKRPRENEEKLEESEESRLFIHYRIVMEEVCLKMDDFMSGMQLVRLIFDCILTHSIAYEEFGLLHRDISTGNLLVSPGIKKTPDGGKEVTWQGLLTDWELAKYVPKDSSAQRARQPERTGTWQFMSVSYVRHPDRPVGVADEMESFFHVLLHHSVRYLRHSLGGLVSDFIMSYYDTFQHRGDRPNWTRCSATKVQAVTDGKICIDETHLRFHNKRGKPQHPLNDLLALWLPLFKARYKLLDLEDSKPSQPAVQEPQEADDEEYAVEDVAARYRNLKKIAITAPANITKDSSSDPETLKQVAAQLNTHEQTKAMFFYHLSEKRWPATDKVGDQLGKDYNPKKHFATMKSMVASGLASGRISTASSKKPKLDPSVAQAAASGSGTAPDATPSPDVRPPKSSKKSLKVIRRGVHRARK